MMARALNRAGLSGAFGHCSLRLDDRHFLVCASRPMGLIQPWESGTVAAINEPLPAGVFGEVRMHQQIYLRRKDVGAICRFTSPNVLSLAAMGVSPVPRHGFGSYFYPQVPMSSSQDLIRTDELAMQVADSMGDAPAVIVGVNGAVTAGESAKQALALAWFLEETARVELAVMSAGRASEAPRLSATVAKQRAVWDQGLTAQRLWDHLCNGDVELDSDQNAP